METIVESVTTPLEARSAVTVITKTTITADEIATVEATVVANNTQPVLDSENDVIVVSSDSDNESTDGQISQD